ncbi:MAG TPA: hypothetical protein VNQ90_02115 [Chthoniobacteraceae bacterium]|nr:hypothetical protein [Chthoniobacteraceae bacterium]
MKLNPIERRRGECCGFSLTEVVIAIGILSFAIISLVALLPIGIDSSRQAGARSDAARLAHALMIDMRTSPPGEASSLYGLPSIYKADDFGSLTPANGLSTGQSQTFYFGDATETTATGFQIEEENADFPGWARLRIVIDWVYVPVAPSKEAMEAVVTVGWPAQNPQLGGTVSARGVFRLHTP